jgi:protein-S-isoprenylcysteine O-methyltransferase Ste14
VGMFITSAYFRSRADRIGGKLRSNEGSKPLIILRILGLLMWLPTFLYVVSPESIRWAQIVLPDWLRIAMMPLLVKNAVLTLWMFRSLDTNITPVHETRQNATLITSGPYKWIRHPLYTFGLTTFLAISILASLWTVAFGTLIFAMLVIWRVPKEEAKLIEVFGDNYRNYMKNTGRFIPKFTSPAD